MPDQLFTDLYRHTENLTWAPTDQVRRRGRQRTRRARVAAGLAGVVAVAVIATGAVALAGGPDAAPPFPPATDSPTPTPSTGPSRAADPTPSNSGSPTGRTPSNPATADGGPATSNVDIPPAAMLQLADLPSGFTAADEAPDGDWTLASTTVYCRNQSPSLAVRQVADRDRVFDSPTDSVIQRVTRHSGDGAASSMDRVRDLVGDCVPYRPGDSLSILADGLGGDESLLVGSLIEGEPSRWLFVRRGDLVAQLRMDEATTPAEARGYARKVADRLCAGTDAC
ncbi:hypothetical protein [Micromonospora sp. WMMD812]|uniref:hypothetical protein n=1 Tax=Micromonospora sp. WMMD812 TaxID=3015152 RepID=UPI00248D1029|nr:hypothetical protein [Micromonospora sp. WMMD812]WBB65863.1 hypothetical protein O7603_22085 [Micromonospora sp. WMMD812]